MAEFAIYNESCTETMQRMAENSLDAIVTDPPYGLSNHSEKDVRKCLKAWLSGVEYTHGKSGFMGKTWDSWVPGPECWREAYRVLKPGGYMLVFSSTRTQDLMGIALRLAGFTMHPAIYYAFGSGFPKATNLGKMIDKAAGAEREVVGVNSNYLRRKPNGMKTSGATAYNYSTSDQVTDARITAPATDLARQWDGWFYGLQSLKPAIEPILMVQKPPVGRMVDNVERWGVGAINVDGCRVGTGTGGAKPEYEANHANAVDGIGMGGGAWANVSGRWPANLILSGEDEVVALFPETASGVMKAGTRRAAQDGPGSVCFGTYGGNATAVDTLGDSGSAARFFQVCPQDDDSDEFVRLFYSAKASRRDRDEGLDAFDEQRCGGMQATADGSMLTGSGNARVTARANHHPTVKPTSLMAYLVRLVTPPGGTVYDPFSGSFTTAKAALIQGFNFIGSEIHKEFCDIGRARAQHAIDNADELRDKYCSSKSLTKAPKVKQGKQKSKPGEMASLF